MGYLGKISAIVSANTSDFSAKLAASGKEVASWARSLNTAVNTASSKASSSLRGIYTEAQKAERALQAIQARKIDFKGFDAANLGQAVGRMQALISATKGVNDPLNRVARTIEKLPIDMQGGFNQALQRAQVQAEQLAQSIDRIGTGLVSDGSLERRFAAATARIRETAEAADRLKEANAGVSGLATGAELRFRRPEFVQEIGRARTLQETAAGTQGGNFADLIGRQRAAADATAVAFARMENAQLTLKGDVRGTTAEYERQLSILRQIGNEIEQAVSATNARTAAEQQAIQAENQFYLQERDRRSGRLARSNSAAFDDATAELMRSPANTAAPIFGAPAKSMDSELQRTRNLYQEFLQLSPQVQAELSDEAQRLDNLARAARDGAAGIGTLSDANDRMAATIGIAKSKMTEQESLEAARRNFSMTPEQLAKTADRGVFQPLGDLEKSAAALRQMQDEMRKLKAMENFGGTTGGFLETSKINRAKGEISALRGILISMGVTTGDAADAVDDLAVSWQRATSEAGGTVKYANLLRQSLSGAVRDVQALADKNGLRVDVSGVVANAGRKAAGDISRAGADKAALALQQLGFAVDDFMSSTGGIDMKLRAISNNITQLGFIAGGTAGLFISLGAVIAANVAIPIVKFIFQTERADEALKALNSALENNKRNVEQLADAYRKLADAIAGSVLSPEDKKKRDRDQTVRDIVKQRRAAEEELFASESEGVSRVRGERAILERRREETRDINERQRLTAEIKAKEREERALLENRGAGEAADLVNRAAAQGEEARRVVMNRTRGFFGDRTGDAVDQARNNFRLARERTDNARATAAGLPGAVAPADTRRQIEALTFSLREAEGDMAAARASGVRTSREEGMAPRPDLRSIDALEETIQRLKGRLEVLSRVLAGQLATELTSGIFALEDSLNRAAEDIQAQAQTGFGSSLAGQRYSISRELTSLTDELETLSDPARAEAIKNRIDELQNESTALESAIKSGSSFAQVIQRISQDLADTVASEMRGEADKARRDANSAQAEMDERQVRAPGMRYTLGPNGELVTGDEQQREARRSAARRERLERDARASEERAFKARQENEWGVKHFEDDVRAGRMGDEMRKLVEERDSQRAIANDETKSEKVRLEARQRADRAQRELDRQYEATPTGQAVRALADEADRQSQLDRARVEQEDRRLEAARQGRDFAGGESMRAAQEFVNRRFQLQQAQAEGYITPQQQAEAEARARREASERVAPAWFSMMEEVQNAVMQGPSRAALNASDASSVEGQRELNRLMRGEDSARDVNLVELEKQTDELRKLNEKIAKFEIDLAN